MLQDGTENWQRGHALRKRYHRGQLPLWLHETNRPPNVTLNPPTCPPTETAVTPSLDDYVLAFADEDDGNAPSLNPPQAPLLTPHGQLNAYAHDFLFLVFSLPKKKGGGVG
jgi:hypothetical protein